MFPHDERFSASNYGNNTRWFILEALKRGAEIEKHRLHRYEMPIAALRKTLLDINSTKETPDLEDFCLYVDREPTDKELIAPAAANAYISLRKDKLIKPWASFFHSELMSAKNDDPTPSPRGFIGENIIILAPEYGDGRIFGSVILMDTEIAGQPVEVMDPDTGHTFVIEAPEAELAGGVTAIGDEWMRRLS